MSFAGGSIGRAIGVWVALVVRRPAVTIVAVLSAAGAGVFFGFEHLGINTDTADMISPELEWRRDFITYRDSFPARENNLVAVVEGPSPAASAAFARQLADALEAEPELFPSVFLAGHGDFFERNGLLYLPLAELERLADRLIAAQPLLGRLAADASGAGIVALVRESLARRAEAPALGGDELDRLLDELAATLEASIDGQRRPIAWGELIGAPTDASARQLLLVKPALDFNRMRPAREAIERLRAVAGELNAERAAPVELRLTGTLAMEHEELSSITSSASTAGIAALLMVVAVLLFVLRSGRLLAIAVVTLLAGLCLTASFAALTVGHLNLLSVAFAVLYVGLGVDFILHSTLRLEELCAAGVDLDAALIETGRGVGSSLLICAVTTAAGFFAFIPTDFDGISELGLISGAGMIISLVVSLSLLPALLKLFRRNRRPAAAPYQQGPRAGLWRPAAPRLTAAAAALIAVGALALLPGLRFDGNPIKLRDPDAESIRALEDLAPDGDAPLFNLAVLVASAAEAESLAARLTELDTVARAESAASLVPEDQDEKLLVLEELDLVLGGALADLEAAPAAPARLTGELGLLANQLARPGAAEPSAVDAESRLAAAAADWLAAEAGRGRSGGLAMTRALDADLQGSLSEQVRRLERGLGARPFGRGELPAALLDRWVNGQGQELVEIVPAEDLTDNEAAARFVDAVRAVAPNATGLPVVYQEASATVTRAFQEALVYAFVAVTLLLLLFLRSVRDLALVLVPIVFAAVVTAGSSVLIGLPLNFANIIALPLLIGVGVDSGIHMVHRMRTEPPKDGDPLHTSTSKAVFASALTTVASFGNLAFASHVGMASMGQLLTLGMAVTLIAVLGLLPALMRLGKLT